jgi:hypothetical protein
LDRTALVERWRELTERVLPEQAQVERWPLRLDHCFKRVCLDWACGGVWYEHSSRPAERRMPEALFRQAVVCAEELAGGGVELLWERNRASLQWRGKPAHGR